MQVTPSSNFRFSASIFAYMAETSIAGADCSKFAELLRMWDAEALPPSLFSKRLRDAAASGCWSWSVALYDVID